MDARVSTRAMCRILGALMMLSACAGEKVSAPPPAVSAATSPPAAAAGNFRAEVVPLLQARCSPCHFVGGKMYEKMPFDRPETIRALGTKLFTRLKDPGDQSVIRAFLEQAE